MSEELGIIERALYHKERYEYFDKKAKKKLKTTKLDKIVDLGVVSDNRGYCPDCDCLTERPSNPNSKRTCYRCEKPFKRLHYEKE